MTKQGLMKIKVRALRRRVWFTALSRVERAIVDLTIRCVERVRSHSLEKSLTDIVNKILKTLETEFPQKAEKIGHELARKICFLAWEWGNLNASTWMYELNFVRFLGVNALNEMGTISLLMGAM